MGYRRLRELFNVSGLGMLFRKSLQAERRDVGRRLWLFLAEEIKSGGVARRELDSVVG